MRRLIIETATQALSLALVEDGKVIGSADRMIGRGHAERLVPEIAALPDGGKSDSIWVDVGPGSFTGVRIGIAAARALAIAWNADCKGFHSAAAVAMTASEQIDGLGEQDFLVVMDGGHGEWLVASVDAGGANVMLPLSQSPETAILQTHAIVVGPRAEEFVAKRGYGEGHMIYPSARAMPGAPSQQLFDLPSPIYSRPPDAKPIKPTDIASKS